MNGQILLCQSQYWMDFLQSLLHFFLHMKAHTHNITSLIEKRPTTEEGRKTALRKPQVVFQFQELGPNF